MDLADVRAFSYERDHDFRGGTLSEGITPWQPRSPCLAWRHAGPRPRSTKFRHLPVTRRRYSAGGEDNDR